MQFDYDKTTDSLYITLIPGGSVDSEEVSDNIILDYNAGRQVVGIDVQHASEQFDLSQFVMRGIHPAFVPMEEHPPQA